MAADSLERFANNSQLICGIFACFCLGLAEEGARLPSNAPRKIVSALSLQIGHSRKQKSWRTIFVIFLLGHGFSAPLLDCKRSSGKRTRFVFKLRTLI